MIFQSGQNLAREYGKLEDPTDRVKKWFDEREYYTYSKYTVDGGACTRKPCGHYVQVRVQIHSIEKTLSDPVQSCES